MKQRICDKTTEKLMIEAQVADKAVRVAINNKEAEVGVIMTRQKEIQEILEILNENPQLEIVSYGLAPKPNGFCYEYDDSYYGEVNQDTIDRFEYLLWEIECNNNLTKQLKSEVF